MARRSASTVFIMAATRWVSTARLAMSLDGIGCRVELMSSRRHPAMSTGAIARWHDYHPLHALRSLRRALASSRPDLLVVADDFGSLLIADLLQRLAAEAERSHAARAEQDALERLIVRSFGRIETFHLAGSRLRMLSEAEAAGVRVLESFAVGDSAAAAALPDCLPGPWILKADAGWGGWAVREVSERAKLLPAWRSLHGSLALPRSLAHGWLNGEWAQLRNGFKSRRCHVLAQRRVTGREFSGIAVAVDGQLAAAACLEAVMPGRRSGRHSVVRLLDDAAITRAMAAVVGRLHLSGFCCFDFIVEKATGELLLLEASARPAQLAHLPMGPGRDLPAALLREVLGRDEVDERPCRPTIDLIALFPQELRRDPRGELARRAFHDVPWDAPGLIHCCTEMLPGRTLPDWLAADQRLAAQMYLMTNEN